MALKKLCSYNGCRYLVDYSEKYCDKHKAIAEQDNKKRYRDYKNRRMADEYEKKLSDFYNTKEWERVRDLVKVKQYGMDIYEYYTTGLIVSGYTVHHIEPIRIAWSKRLDIDNLIYLTESSHQAIHKMLDKDYNGTVKMLHSMLDKFKEEFNI